MGSANQVTMRLLGDGDDDVGIRVSSSLSSTLHTTCLSGLWALGSGLWVHYIDHYYNITVYQSSTIYV